MADILQTITGIILSLIGFVCLFAETDTFSAKLISLIVSVLFILLGIYLLSKTKLWKNTSNRA